jgi:hypothetical protein
MAFKRPENKIVPVDLNAVTAQDVEKKIIESVRRFATRQDNWAAADKNTSFLGHITGMGVESSNRVDITMAIERQFLTRLTRRVPAGDSGGFRLEPGELGKLTILEGEDTFAATPGLAVKMLMDLGHMPKDEGYLRDVVSFANVLVVGEGYRLEDSLRRALARSERAPDDNARADSLANVRALCEQTRGFLKNASDPAQIHRLRREASMREEAAVKELQAELEDISQKLKTLPEGAQPEAMEALRSRQTALRLRAPTANLSLQIAKKVSQDCAHWSTADEARLGQVCAALNAALACADDLLKRNPACSSATIS